MTTWKIYQGWNNNIRMKFYGNKDVGLVPVGQKVVGSRAELSIFKRGPGGTILR
jgi:hypothetical protein